MTIDQMSNDVGTFHWLLDQFVEDTDGVREAIAVCNDGILLAASSASGRSTDQLAALTTGLASLSRGASKMFDMGRVHHMLVELEDGHLFTVAGTDGCALAVLADKGVDLGRLGYHVTVMSCRLSAILSPALERHMKNALTPWARAA